MFKKQSGSMAVDDPAQVEDTASESKRASSTTLVSDGDDDVVKPRQNKKRRVVESDDDSAPTVKLTDSSKVTNDGKQRVHVLSFHHTDCNFQLALRTRRRLALHRLRQRPLPLQCLPHQ
jgi:hypothetical protein